MAVAPGLTINTATAIANGSSIRGWIDSIRSGALSGTVGFEISGGGEAIMLRVYGPGRAERYERYPEPLGIGNPEAGGYVSDQGPVDLVGASDRGVLGARRRLGLDRQAMRSASR